MGHVWSDANRFAGWLEVEIAAAETLAETGQVPKEAAAAIRTRAKIDVARIHELEARVKHDVIAFTMAVGESIGDPAVARWLHYGMTSNDVVDTAQALQVRDASKLIERGLVMFGEILDLLAHVGAALERIALEIRHLQRTEVREAEEPFSEGQRGSSAMPHKRNPVSCEQICGLARLVRSNMLAAFENVALWHERDISHSSVERVILPDSTILIDYMLSKMAMILGQMRVFPERMQRNLESTNGLVYSGQLLQDLVEKGMPRDDAYKAVQENAMAAWETDTSFRDRAAKDARIAKVLDSKALAHTFDLRRQLRSVDAIFDRVFGAHPAGEKSAAGSAGKH